MTDSQIIEAVRQKEEVVLLGLSVQDIQTVEDNDPIFGLIPNPLGNRKTIIQYGFTANLGLDGEQVDVDRRPDGSLLVSIPAFIFIGYDDVDIVDPITEDGLLSIFTDEIDQSDMIDRILGEENQQAYVDGKLPELRDQAEVFYRGIISSVDPAVAVAFDFAQ